MTPKEKAQYLIYKFTPHAYGVWDKNGSKEERYHSKQCALIAVDEIMDALEKNGSWNYDYWQEVKLEIEKL